MIRYAYDDAGYIDQLVADGYSLDVAEYQLRNVKEKLQREFKEKCKILEGAFLPVSVTEFFNDVFFGIDRYMVIVSGNETEKGSYREMELGELVEYQADRNDVYVPPCSFINGHYSNGTCRDLYAIVIDIDEVDPDVLKRVIENGTLGYKIPMPTYLVNSGRGLHAYYCFSRPVPFFKKNRPSLKTLYNRLFGIYKQNIAAEADWHGLIQPYRMPGSRTKLGQQATAYACNEKWDIMRLSDKIGVSFEGDIVQLEVLPQREYNEKHKKQLVGRKCPACGNALVFRENGSGVSFIGCMGFPACDYMEDLDGNRIKKRKKARTRKNTDFYTYCLETVKQKTQQGNRYMAMLGLVIVAYKAGIEKEQVEHDLYDLIEHFDEIGAHMQKNKKKKALRGYNQKAILCRSETLERYFGWQFRRPTKKEPVIDFESEQRAVDQYATYHDLLDAAGILDENGKIITKKYRAWNAREARDQRQNRRGTHWYDNHGRKSKKDEINAWKNAHPNGTIKECIADLKISRSTAYKWWEKDVTEK